MSSLRYVHKTTWHFYRAFGANRFSFPLSFLPPAEDILIVNALKQRVKHSQRQSEVNKNTFYTSTSPPSEAILKIVNNKHSYCEYILSISFSGHDFVFSPKNNFFLKTSLEILLQRCQNSYH